MPHGLPHTTTESLDPIFETLKMFEEQFATPETGRRAERFARGQERQAADLTRLFEQAQQPPRRTFGDKITPILEAIALIADATSSSRRRRGEALPKFQAIKGAREERIERKRQQRRQEFAGQADILGLVGQGKGAAFRTRQGEAERKAQRKRGLFGLAITAQPKPVKEMSFADKTKKQEREDFTAAQRVLNSFADERGNIRFEDIPDTTRLNIEAAYEGAGRKTPFPDTFGLVNDLRKQFFNEATTIYKDADPEQKEALIEAYVDRKMLAFAGPVSGGFQGATDADFLPAIEPFEELEDAGLSAAEFFERAEQADPSTLIKRRRQPKEALPTILDFLKRTSPGFQLFEALSGKE